MHDQNCWYIKEVMQFLKRSLIALGLSLVMASCGVEIDDSDTQLGGRQRSSVSARGETILYPLNHPDRGGNEAAQSFQLTQDRVLSSIELPLVRKGAPDAGSVLMISIMGNDLGRPRDPELSSASIKTSDIRNAFVQDYSFSFPDKIILQKNTSYWIHVEALYPESSTDHILWQANLERSYSLGEPLIEPQHSNDWESPDFGEFLFTIVTDSLEKDEKENEE
jgi:hypothetical protein